MTAADAVFLGIITQNVTSAAHDYHTAITDAKDAADLAEVQEALDEAIGALLAQEQILIRQREIFQILQKEQSR